MVTDLVYVKESQVVTDSTTIAAAFDKRHDKVLRDIRSLKCSDTFHSANYGESLYKNKQGRSMPMYIVTQDGFAMLAMGYTGEKSMQFKERYINAFNRTRTELESQAQIGDMANVGRMIESHEDMITLRSLEQREIQQMVKKHIHSLYPYTRDRGRRKHYARLYQQLKDRFSVTSFRDIRLIDFEDAKAFIRMWGLAKIGES